MAKRKRRKKEPDCDVPNCLMCKLWPEIEPAFGKDSCFYVDEITGEVVIHTGLRALPDLQLVLLDKADWYGVQCECGNKGHIRGDLLERGRSGGCPNCSASAAQLGRN